MVPVRCPKLHVPLALRRVLAVDLDFKTQSSAGVSWHHLSHIFVSFNSKKRVYLGKGPSLQS